MPAPANDNFANREVLPGASGSVIRSNVGATMEAGEPDPSGGAGETVWFEWVAPSDGLFRFTITSDFGKLFVLYTGGTLATLSAENSQWSDDPGQPFYILLEATSGTSYKFQVGGYLAGSTGSFTLSWLYLPPPANDDMANTLELLVDDDGGGSLEGTTLGATTDTPYDPLVDESIAGGATVWYKLAVPDDWVDDVTRLRMTLVLIDSPGTTGTLPALEIFAASAYPPTSVGDWADLTSGYPNPSISYRGPAPASGWFYIGVGAQDASPAEASDYTLSWAFSGVTRGTSIAPGDATLEPVPFWIPLDDVGGYDFLSGWQIDRGRTSEFEQTGTGTAVATFLDREGVLDPTNPDGPFAGQIDPMIQARIGLYNPVEERHQTIFRGFGDWSFDIDEAENLIVTTLELADAFDLFSAIEMYPGHFGAAPPPGVNGDIFFENGPPGTILVAGPSRLHGVLDDAGWSELLRKILTGNVIIGSPDGGNVYARLDALMTVISDAADAEFPGLSNRFMDKIGRFTFYGRYARFDPTNPDYNIQSWKVGDQSAFNEDHDTALISGHSFRRSKADLINAASCTPQSPALTDAEVAASLVKDDASIAKYAWRSVSYPDLLTYRGRTSPETTDFDVNAVDETKLYAEFLVHNFKQPRTRVSQIRFRTCNPTDPDAAARWKLLCEVEIGDIVHLKTTHPGGGGFNEDFYVEGLHYVGAPMRRDIQDVTLNLDVSPKALYDFNPFA